MKDEKLKKLTKMLIAYRLGVDTNTNDILEFIKQVEDKARQSFWDNVSEEKMRMATAQGYCTSRNSTKVVDPDLIEDIIQAILEAGKKGELDK